MAEPQEHTWNNLEAWGDRVRRDILVIEAFLNGRYQDKWHAHVKKHGLRSDQPGPEAHAKCEELKAQLPEGDPGEVPNPPYDE
jgi:hypothetical protein